MPTLTPAAPVTDPELSPGGRPARPLWGSGPTFVLAAAGSAIGLGNIWKFPHLAREHGGGAFVLVYLAAVALIAVPVLTAELMLGRRARRNPVDALATLARRERHAAEWRYPAWIAIAASLLVLAVYSVVGGWTLAYLGYSLRGELDAITPTDAARHFAALLADPLALVGWHLAFLAPAALIVGAGVRRGVERSARWLVPLLLVVLLALAAYSAVVTGRLAEAAIFMFRPDFTGFGMSGALAAMGQACFSLSIGMGAMLAYGSYAPPEVSLPRAAAWVAVLDTGASFLAGLAIFPIVFALGLEPGEGPGLVFLTLPLAFGSMPGGGLVGALFFLLLVLAALTSAVSVLEPAVSLLQERLRLPRIRATACVLVVAAIAGVAPALSFSTWADVRIGGRGIFDLVQGLATGVLVPVAAAGIALFAGRVVSRRVIRAELRISARQYFAWRLVLGWIVPFIVAVLLLAEIV